MSRVQLTILNAMAGSDFAAALDQHVAWGLSVVDLKDQIFGKAVMDLTDEEAARAAEMIRARGLSVYCLSTGLFYGNVEKGESYFRDTHLLPVDRAIALARILRPTYVRLLAAWTERRPYLDDAVANVVAHHGWLFDLYRDAIRRLRNAGFVATVENEVHGCILATPAEVERFFRTLACDNVTFTWDVQNLWQMGTYPTVEVYAQLKEFIGYYHLKGGIQCPESRDLCWRSSLADATWPVAEITRRVIEDGVSPVICLNPSHGEVQPGVSYEDVTARDVAYARGLIDEVDP